MRTGISQIKNIAKWQIGHFLECNFRDLPRSGGALDLPGPARSSGWCGWLRGAGASRTLRLMWRRWGPSSRSSTTSWTCASRRRDDCAANILIRRRRRRRETGPSPSELSLVIDSKCHLYCKKNENYPLSLSERSLGSFHHASCNRNINNCWQ